MGMYLLTQKDLLTQIRREKGLVLANEEVRITNEESKRSRIPLVDMHLATDTSYIDKYFKHGGSEKYDKNDEGPFLAVLVQNREADPNPPSPVELGRLMCLWGIKFSELIRVTKFSWRVKFSSYHDANNAVDNEYIKKKPGCKLFIPDWMVNRIIVLKGIPVDVAQEELVKEIAANNPELRPIIAERLKRRIIVNGKSEFIDSKSLKITLRTRRIPSSINLWNTKNPTDVYVPGIRQCYKCGRLGHSTKFCNNPPTCITCGQPEHKDDSASCQLPAKCTNCNGSHKSLDRSCPEVIKRKNIARLMASEGLDFFTAKRQLEERMNNQLSQLTYGNFPPLKSKSSVGSPSPPRCSCLQSQRSSPRQSYSQSVGSHTKLSGSSGPQSTRYESSPSSQNSTMISETMPNLNEEEIFLWQRIMDMLENSNNKLDLFKKIARVMNLSSMTANQ